MENALKIGKHSLIGLVWLVIVLAWFDFISIDALITFSIVLFWIIGAVTVGFAIFNIFENPKTGLKFIIGAVALIIILSISFGVSDTVLDENEEVIAGSQLAEAGIYTLNILSISALIVIVLAEAKRILKL
tara:strand:+ start:2453 stop:2845 length:393 start_codon:yes stop_codon:yes gene_type:complete